MKPIYILLNLAITIFAGCNKNKTDADWLYTDTVWAYVSDNHLYVMDDTTVWKNGEPFLQNGMEYRNVSETELCNVENLISTFLKKEKCKVVTKRDRILDNYFKQCIGFKCKQTRYVFVTLYAFEIRQKFKPTDDGYYTLAVLAQNSYNTIINAFPPKTHNIYNLVLMVNLTAQTVEWYNSQKNRL